MKSQAYKHRTEREFVVGDSVFLKLQPYVQANRTCQKLSFRFYGPFTILERVGQVAYKLDLPVGAKIHPVVHVSQLKKHIPASTSVISDLSFVCADPAQVFQPERVLHRRFIIRGAAVVPQLLIQWTALPPELVIWEDERMISADLKMCSE